MNLKEIHFFMRNLLNSNFGHDSKHDLDSSITQNVYFRLDFLFKKIKRKYYKNNIKYFDLLNADHLCICFYLYSYECFKKKKIDLAKKFFLLNKIFNGIDLFYKIKMPKIFMFCHPQGSVIGNAEFSNYCIFFQNITIGRKGKNYPKFSEGIIFYPGSKIIGKCKVGKNVIFAPDSSIIDTNVPSNTLVSGRYPNNLFKKNKHNIISEFFKSNKKIKI